MSIRKTRDEMAINQWTCLPVDHTLRQLYLEQRVQTINSLLLPIFTVCTVNLALTLILMLFSFKLGLLLLIRVGVSICLPSLWLLLRKNLGATNLSPFVTTVD